MPDYILTFTGYINERIRPENFPKTVEDVLLEFFANGEELVKYVNARIFMYAKNNGMGVTMDKKTIEDLSVVDTNRMWVSMNIITHITATYKVITGELPSVSLAGITEFASGKALVKN